MPRMVEIGKSKGFGKNVIVLNTVNFFFVLLGCCIEMIDDKISRDRLPVFCFSKVGLDNH